MTRFSSILLIMLSLSAAHGPEPELLLFVETTIAYESFEGTAGELGYTSNDFSDGFSDYADVVNNTNAGAGAGITYHISTGFPANIHDDGTGDQHFYAVDDLDDNGNPRTDQLAIITFNNVDVSSATNLKVKLLLGTDRVNRFETDDYFQIYYAFDTDITAHPGATTAFTKGGYTLLVDYRGSGDNTNASLDADFNGSGDGTQVLPSGTSTSSLPNNDLIMSDLSFDIAGTGTNLSIRIVMQTDSGDETFILDNVRVTGEVAASAPSSATVVATAFLEGAYNGTNLNTTLNSSLPTAQPYSGSSFNNHAVTESATAPAGAVDWVLVELREAGSAAAAVNTTKVGSAAGFLMSDGTIKATDGTSNLTVSLTGNTGADFYVVIYHRNHLPIMSASAISESGGTYSIDFTSNSANTYQTTTALKSLSGGRFGMPAGDIDQDGDIDGADLSTWQTNNGAVFNYASNGVTDLNMDGEINAVDRNDFHQKNTSKTRQVPSS